MKTILTLLIFLSINIYGQTSPKDIVHLALISLTNGDLQTLSTITENAELRKTKELLTYIENSPKKKQEIYNQYKNIKSWKFTGSKEHNISNRIITIVNAELTIAPTLETLPGTHLKNANDLKNKTSFVDYMLEKFDNKWKIISIRALY